MIFDLLTSRFLFLYAAIGFGIFAIFYCVAGYAYVLGRERGRQEAIRDIRRLGRYR